MSCPDLIEWLMATARAEHGKEGPQAVARATEAARVEWIERDVRSIRRLVQLPDVGDRRLVGDVVRERGRRR